VPPVLLVLAGVGSIQFGAALAATLFSQAGPAGTSLLRGSFAAAILVALTRPDVASHPLARLRLAALLGLSLAAMNLCFYEALARIPLGAAVTVEFIGPLGVAVASSRRALDALWVALAAAGIALLTSGLHGAHSSAGIGLAALAGCFWAAYILINARAAVAFRGAGGLAIAMTVGAVALLGPGLGGAGERLFAPGLLGLGALVALLGSVIPYSLETEALRRLPTGAFSVLMSLEPAVAALAGFAVLGQRLSASQVVAIALVVLASGGASRASRAPTVGV
jgi:inner membrane transporter RhtA